MSIFKPCFVILLFTFSGLAQTAPQRSDELCGTLNSWAADNGRKFIVSRPCACIVDIDTGYSFFIDYGPDELVIGLGINPALLNGDAGAFWLRLSTFDNLVYSALGTKQQLVFDEINKLAKRLAAAELQAIAKGGTVDLMLNSKGGSVLLGAKHDKKTGLSILMASARTNDIEKMKSQAMSASDRIPAWRRILSQSLLAFAAGANAYGNAYRNSVAQPIYRAPVTCYSNFLGPTVITNCY